MLNVLEQDSSLCWGYGWVTRGGWRIKKKYWTHQKNNNCVFNTFFVILHPYWHGQCLGKYFKLPRWLECAIPLESLSGELDFGARFPTTNVKICFQQFSVFKKWWAKVEHRNTINTALKHASSYHLMSATSRAIIDKDIDENGDFEGGPPLRQFPGSVGVVVKAFYLRWNI